MPTMANRSTRNLTSAPKEVFPHWTIPPLPSPQSLGTPVLLSLSEFSYSRHRYKRDPTQCRSFCVCVCLLSLSMTFPRSGRVAASIRISILCGAVTPTAPWLMDTWVASTSWLWWIGYCEHGRANVCLCLCFTVEDTSSSTIARSCVGPCRTF
jgi:hypothetical protein